MLSPFRISRHRLLASLENAPRLVVIRAPAGYGKSILMDQWADHAQGRVPIVRAALGDPDRDPSHFAGRIRKAIENARSSGADDLLLLLDDADVIADSDSVAALGDMLQREPGLRLGIASRGAIGLPLGRLRLAGELMEIGSEALRLDERERRTFLAGEKIEDRVSGARLAEIEAKLAGWPTGYRMLAIRCSQPAVAMQASPAGWKELVDYYEEETLAGLPSDLAKWLHDIAMLPDLTPEGCEQISGNDQSRQLLLECYRLGIDISPTNHGYSHFTLHPLFAEFLRTRLSRADQATLLDRTLAILSKAGDYVAAGRLALDAGDHARASEFLNAHYRFSDGLSNMEVIGLVRRLQSDERERFPHLLLAMALHLMFGFHLGKAERLMRECRSYLDGPAKDQISREEREELEILLLNREMMLALYRNQDDVASRQCEELLKRIQDAQPKLRAIVLTVLIQTRLERFNHADVERLYLLGRRATDEIDRQLSHLPLETFYTRHLFENGRGEEAVARLTESLSRAEHEAGKGSPLVSSVAIALAMMKVEQADYQMARDLVETYLPQAEGFGFVSLIIGGRIAHARILLNGGEIEQGLAVLQQPPSTAGEMFERVKRALTIERIVVLLQLGRSREAQTAADAIGLAGREPPMPGKNATAMLEAQAYAWIAIERSRDRIDDALRVARGWLRYGQGLRINRLIARWNVAVATLLVLQGDPQGAKRNLRAAVQASAGSKFWRIFLAEAPIIQDLLREIAIGMVDERERAFLEGLFTKSLVNFAATERDVTQIAGALTTLELDVLRLVERGLSNREIGNSLGMTEGTVKWYLQGVYDKLGVRRRSLAAITAKRLSLIE